MTNEELKEQVEMALKATNSSDVYSTGMRNAFRWVLSCITDEAPEFESAKKESSADRWLARLIGVFIGLIMVALLKYIIGI